MDAVDRLYRLPPDEFVAARDELARQLRSTGDKEQAAEVKTLRRPTVAAWALNQVARQRRDDVETLAEIAEDLRRAQERALTGGDADQLRKVGKLRREMVVSLTEAASAVLARTGRDAKIQIPAIAAILDAAVSNPGVAEALRAGRLVSEPEPSDLDAFGFLAEAASDEVDLRDDAGDRPIERPTARTTGRPGARFTGPPMPTKEDKDLLALRKAVGRAQWERDAAYRATKDTETARRAAAERATAVDKELDQVRRRVDALEEAAGEAADQLDAATSTHDEASARLAAADAALDHAREKLEERGG